MCVFWIEQCPAPKQAGGRQTYQVPDTHTHTHVCGRAQKLELGPWESKCTKFSCIHFQNYFWLLSGTNSLCCAIGLHSENFTCGCMCTLWDVLIYIALPLAQHPGCRVPRAVEDLPQLVGGLVKQSCKNGQCTRYMYILTVWGLPHNCLFVCVLFTLTDVEMIGVVLVNHTYMYVIAKTPYRN